MLAVAVIVMALLSLARSLGRARRRVSRHVCIQMRPPEGEVSQLLIWAAVVGGMADQGECFGLREQWWEWRLTIKWTLKLQLILGVRYPYRKD